MLHRGPAFMWRVSCHGFLSLRNYLIKLEDCHGFHHLAGRNLPSFLERADGGGAACGDLAAHTHNGGLFFPAPHCVSELEVIKFTFIYSLGFWSPGSPSFVAILDFVESDCPCAVILQLFPCNSCKFRFLVVGRFCNSSFGTCDVMLSAVLFHSIVMVFVSAFAVCGNYYVKEEWLPSWPGDHIFWNGKKMNIHYARNMSNYKEERINI